METTLTIEQKVSNILNNVLPKNVYINVDGKEPTNLDLWVMRGTEFKHRYGDGAEICVMKGIQAINGGQK
jgi:hypothetical protein